MFAQAVYFMFSLVYVCKETVEHLLLSSGEGHHHHGDEIEGLGCVETINIHGLSDWVYSLALIFLFYDLDNFYFPSWNCNFLPK